MRTADEVTRGTGDPEEGTAPGLDLTMTKTN